MKDWLSEWLTSVRPGNRVTQVGEACRARRVSWVPQSVWHRRLCVCSLRRVPLSSMIFWIHGYFHWSLLHLHDYMPEAKVLRTIYCFYRDKPSWWSLKFGVVPTGGPQDVSVGPHSTGTTQWIAPGPCWAGAVSNFSPALCFFPVARLKFVLSRLFCCPFRLRNIIVTSASLTPVFVDDIWP